MFDLTMNPLESKKLALLARMMGQRPGTRAARAARSGDRSGARGTGFGGLGKTNRVALLDMVAGRGGENFGSFGADPAVLSAQSGPRSAPGFGSPTLSAGLGGNDIGGGVGFAPGQFGPPGFGGAQMPPAWIGGGIGPGAAQGAGGPPGGGGLPPWMQHMMRQQAMFDSPIDPGALYGYGRGF